MPKNKNNELNAKGNITSEGNINIGSSIDKQEINFNISPSTEQLKDIIHNEIKLELKEQQIVAYDEASKRLQKLSEVIFPKLVKSEMIDAFSDPAIQVYFREIMKTAICTEREADFSILSELLTYRIKNKKNILKKASIYKATEIVDKISDDALCALTIKYCTSFIPTSGNISEGLKALDSLYGNILADGNIPKDNNWVDNAEILGTVRVNTIAEMKKFEEIYYDSLLGYVSEGIKKDSELYKTTIKKLTENNLPTDILVNHELNLGYVRLNIHDREAIRNIILISTEDQNKINLSESQLKIYESIFDSYKDDKTSSSKIKENFKNKLNEYPSLSKVLNWWNDNLSPAITLNSIGRVLAHTNAKRLYNDMPDMV